MTPIRFHPSLGWARQRFGVVLLLAVVVGASAPAAIAQRSIDGPSTTLGNAEASGFVKRVFDAYTGMGWTLKVRCDPSGDGRADRRHCDLRFRLRGIVCTSRGAVVKRLYWDEVLEAQDVELRGFFRPMRCRA